MYNRKDYDRLYEKYKRAGGDTSSTVGQNLFALSQIEHQTNRQYNQASGVLDNVRNSANIETLSLQDRINKYLPQSLKQQGLDGLGVAQRYKENMSKAYDNQLARIGAEYDRQQEALYSNYRQATDPLYEGTKDEFGNKATDGYDDYFEVYKGLQKVNSYNKLLDEVSKMQDEGKPASDIVGYIGQYKTQDFGDAQQSYDKLIADYTAKLEEEANTKKAKEQKNNVWDTMTKAQEVNRGAKPKKDERKKKDFWDYLKEYSQARQEGINAISKGYR